MDDWQPATIGEVLKVMRERPNRKIIFATHSFTAWGVEGVSEVDITAGDIFVTDGLSHDADVPKSMLDQLLADGLIEKESEDFHVIRYKLTERAR